MPTSREIRQAFLDHFAKRGHAIVPSAPMVVKDDPTLMFTNAGMNQFKDLFLGNRPVTDPRIADTQKCLRVSGKHNDLEEVGIDTYHHTMFEMLGNWSFGDYFKKEAVQWAWELLVDTFKIDPANIYVTYFGGDAADKLEADNETRDLWLEYLPGERVLPFSKKDNFWEMGETGPCGPCTEIHADVRSDAEKAKTPGKDLVNNDHPQVIEIWNNVFMQYERKANGSLLPLPAKHVDTGMGFERLCMVLQGKRSNYDTDVFQPLIQALAKSCGKEYGASISGIPGQAIPTGGMSRNDGSGERADIAMRVIADHLRAIAFAIADGQLPSNTGAGYVIRRILRRAVRYGYSFLGLQEPFIHALVPVLVEQMGEQFPELAKQQELITNVILEEERSFLRTLELGTKRLEQLVAESKGTLDGAKAFELFDTFGFPIDLTRLMAREQGVDVDMLGFEKELKKQKDRSRAATAITTGDWTELAEGTTEFVGYDELATEAKILRYRKVKDKAGDRYQVVLDRTPFYPEGGGQIGDQGWLAQGGTKVTVLDTRRENQLIVHFTTELPQDVSAPLSAEVDEHRRKLTRRNHSATHLLHYALRKVLGTHVEQKGSMVAPDRLRFDISHFAKVTPEELAQVEAEVKDLVRADLPLQELRDTPVKEAMAMGAMALFGEKYGDAVRVIKFGDSVELCGGIHVPRTGEIGGFRIVSEGALAAGIRRIEAITSEAVEQYVEERLSTLDTLNGLLKHPADITAAVNQLLDQNANLAKEVEKAGHERVGRLQETILAKAVEVNGARVIAEEVDLDANGMRDLAFRLKDANPDLLLVMGARQGDKALLGVMVGQALLDKGVAAPQIIKALASEIKGGGGGQAFYATAGGKDPEGLPRALKKATTLLEPI
ncbi:MAG: alanine--tRNA ligase [Flavobacteriales bacterium]|jgi:alanyl-tRNA synthetase|nr:alanine--tRNA ligase [Flavobacteriales bacterium]MBK9599961.1 alanine--tRNA ligase [Flavobacteriales bacterium]